MQLCQSNQFTQLHCTNQKKNTKIWRLKRQILLFFFFQTHFFKKGEEEAERMTKEELMEIAKDHVRARRAQKIACATEKFQDAQRRVKDARVEADVAREEKAKDQKKLEEDLILECLI